MATTSERIKEAMELLNMKQADLVERTGISKGALSSYISGRYLPKQTNIYLIAKALNVNEAWLMGSDVPMNRTTSSRSSGVKINVLGRVAAGIPIEAVEEIIDQEEITEELARTGSFFGLQIKGNSMEPRICEGDVVIALINGDDAVCKRLRKYRDGIELISNNPSYEPMYFDNDEIEKKPVRIIGKVVELRGKF